jgi:hypothetical protein
MAAKSSDKPAAKAPARAKRATGKRKPKQATPTHEEIATRAFFIAEEPDATDPFHNWLRAEDELKAG